MPALLEPRELANLGAFLRDGRERRGLTLDQIASSTRIPRRHLDALEHGDLTVIPGGMYRRAEVRAFADAVGLDRNLALARLEQALDGHVTPDPPARQPLVEAPRRQWGAYAALALLAVASLGLATRWQWTSSPPRAERIGETAAPAAPLEGQVAAPLAAAAEPLTAAPSQPLPERATAPGAATDATDPVTPPAESAFVVSSTPAGARVLVDGIGWGQTPVTIRHLSPGEHRLRVVLDGFVSAERRVRVTAGRGDVKAHVDLAPAK